jgi:hypothetical protein
MAFVAEHTIVEKKDEEATCARFEIFNTAFAP